VLFIKKKNIKQYGYWSSKWQHEANMTYLPDYNHKLTYLRFN